MNSVLCECHLERGMKEEGAHFCYRILSNMPLESLVFGFLRRFFVVYFLEEICFQPSIPMKKDDSGLEYKNRLRSFKNESVSFGQSFRWLFLGSGEDR